VKRCLELIYDGEALERAMHLESGQFITRVAGFCKLFTEPPGPPKFFTRPFAPSKFFTGPFALSNIFTKPFAAGWIYPAALAAWTTWHCSYIIVAWPMWPAP
jgi:hypothetical protein